MTRVTSLESYPFSFAHMASKPKLVKLERLFFEDLKLPPHNGKLKIPNHFPFFPQREGINLSQGWYRANPLLGAYYKVFNLGKNNNPDCLFIIAWVKEEASMVHSKPLPKCSLFYKYLTSTDPEKQKHLAKLEQLILNAFIEAKNFLTEDEKVQIGLEIAGGTDYIMAVRGPLGGVEVAYPYIDFILEAIINGDNAKANIMQRFFKSAFAHEITHEIRNEIEENENTGQEIASHAINFLAGCGEDQLHKSFFDEFLEDVKTDYDIDTICGMKVVYYKLSNCKNVSNKPNSFTPSELNKAMLSIPEKIREKTLKQIAREILYASPIELLRIAAGIEPVKKGEVICLMPELEKAS